MMISFPEEARASPSAVVFAFPGKRLPLDPQRTFCLLMTRLYSNKYNTVWLHTFPYKSVLALPSSQTLFPASNLN